MEFLHSRSLKDLIYLYLLLIGLLLSNPSFSQSNYFEKNIVVPNHQSVRLSDDLHEFNKNLRVLEKLLIKRLMMNS